VFQVIHINGGLSMQRFMGVLVVVFALLGLMLSHGVTSVQAKAEKQLVCHVTGAGAHIIEISVNAVPAHLRNHGDCLLTSTDRALIGEPCDPTDANDNDICDIQP
jgi:flagellar motor component MotA